MLPLLKPLANQPFLEYICLPKYETGSSKKDSEEGSIG